MSKPKVPKAPPPPAAAPPAPPIQAPQRDIGGQEEGDLNKRRKRGRKKLRIDPQSGGAGSTAGGQGLNLPAK